MGQGCLTFSDKSLSHFSHLNSYDPHHEKTDPKIFVVVIPILLLVWQWQRPWGVFSRDVRHMALIIKLSSEDIDLLLQSAHLLGDSPGPWPKNFGHIWFHYHVNSPMNNLHRQLYFRKWPCRSRYIGKTIKNLGQFLYCSPGYRMAKRQIVALI